MTAYEDLLEWAGSRPWWQQQVLARLAAGQAFDQTDFEAVAESLLKDAPVEPSGGWLTAMQQPADSPGPPVRLTAIRDVVSVNRLAEAQQLTFAQDGLTVIYGNNGSGKSGYARLIKRMVRTRHREDVLPDIFATGASPQSACLDYQVGGTTHSALLSDEPPTALAQVAYYDERCGDAYVTTEGEVTYRPSVLRLLDELVQVCDGARAVLDRRLAGNAKRRRALPDLPAPTAAQTFVGQLSGATSDDELQRACTSPPDAEERIEQARQEEGRLRATDPTKEARRLTTLAKAYSTLSAHLDTLNSALGTAPEERLRSLQRTAIETRAAADAASSASFDGEPLQGVGGDAWQSMWEAARRYSETVAYPDDAFPVTGAKADCVLCHQTLDDEAADRFTRFERFMVDDTEERARTAAQALTTHRTTIYAATVTTTDTAVALSSITDDDEELQLQISADLPAWSTRRTALLNEPLLDDLLPPPSIALKARIKERSRMLSDQAARIEAQQFEVTLASLVSDQRELSATVSLSQATDDVRAERDRRREEESLQGARKQTDTRRISRASGDLTTKHVTLLVQDRFSRESQDLKVDTVTLVGRGVRRGSVLHQPDFVGAVLSANLPQVLSEGEQTALGLAGFFVEAHLDGTRSTLVLDDPVTSLDHLRREHVARRLTRFARDRQVVVFTHDVVFAGDLRRIAGEDKVPFAARSVERRGADPRPGYCRTDHPWKAQGAQSRLGILKQDLVKLRKGEAEWDTDTYEREVGGWAGRLSETWERFISQDIAGALFDRGTQEVRLTMLKVIEQFSEEDNKKFQEAYKRVSRWATRHDKDASLNYVAPSVDDLQVEWDVANGWYERLKKYKDRKN